MTDWTAVGEALSLPRLSHYRDECDGDLEHALKLYAWNAEMAAAFQLPLGQLEVVVRNAIHDALTIRAGTDRWWEHSQLGVAPWALKELAATVGDVKARRRGAKVTGDDVIPHLGFGFWCRMLRKHHENLWRRVLHGAFPHLPLTAKRADLQRELDHMREFRNRVAHLERIFHRDLAADYDTILRCVAYVSPPTAVWVDDLSRVVEVRQQRPSGTSDGSPQAEGGGGLRA